MMLKSVIRKLQYWTGHIVGQQAYLKQFKEGLGDKVYPVHTMTWGAKSLLVQEAWARAFAQMDYTYSPAACRGIEAGVMHQYRKHIKLYC
jgi:hypothetical protein